MFRPFFEDMRSDFTLNHYNHTGLLGNSLPQEQEKTPKQQNNAQRIQSWYKYTDNHWGATRAENEHQSLLRQVNSAQRITQKLDSVTTLEGV